MKRAPRSRQRHDLYAKYHDYDSEISDLLGECGMNIARAADATIARAEYILARYVISTDKDVGRLYQSEWRRAGLQLELLARQVRDSPPQKALVAQLRLAYRERGRELDDIALRTSYDQKMGSLARFHQAGKAESLKRRSEEHTSELQSLMRISYAVFCLKKKK